MSYQSRYDWTGEETRRRKRARLVSGVALAMIAVALCVVVLRYFDGY